ncbi:ribosome biogenesis GTP-binding protein YihA/YsxC [Paenibacillus thermoaerophilus]|uniref:Probable GTP-binding protein EngB n=1 Tax=Paenibacillus thermoaerophilus TaxID=1215385 RepID=A0ABW2V7H7_9BACL|nr:ribosome biogenesis GTP-binding protein YihA/YsxC [Paenibacillus thermoaerophilus]TMV11083.1 YihA family ribosome biogenesis GTP-binding protein [Paenibacillus thermoaerophilus]
MNVHHAQLAASAVGPAQYPSDGLPEVALAGRSNVGKSSLINKLINRRNLARTSSQPGKTQTLNFYRIENRMYLTDLPGYGFAKVSKTTRAKWGKMIEEYLLKRDRLKLVLHVIDLRHPPTQDDILMYDWLTHYDVPIVIVATKADKVPRGKWQKHAKVIRETLMARDIHPLVLFSAETGMGKDELWKHILDRLPAAETIAAES